jgi:nucleotidyltransferase/DNA polymerase involved in DNA repair
MASRNASTQRQIAYAHVPYFVTQLARDARPALSDRPLVLLDDTGRVLDADARASAAGVARGQTERQVIARCPVAHLEPATQHPIVEAQEEFIAAAARYADRWQAAGLGALYLDITGLRSNLVEWCQELARAINAVAYAPVIGLTNCKFGASVAAQVAVPAYALVLDPVAQRTFLAQQNVALLPLESEILLQLRHLGIRTLGQYVRLPASAVLTRWGQAGRTAQQWAQGNDDRPVLLPFEQPQLAARIEFDGVLSDRDILLAALSRKAEELLAPLHAQFQAVGKLRLTITRGDRRVVSVAHTFPLPTAASNSIKLALRAQLDQIAWDGEGATDASLSLSEIADAPTPQLTLFDAPTPRETLAKTLTALSARYGAGAFHMASLTEPDHPLPERRASWQVFQ